MPIRVYRCPNGHETEVPLPSGPYSKTHACDWCLDADTGEPSVAKAVPARFAGKVPALGREAALAKRGLIPWERGMEHDARRAREYKQEKFDRVLEQHVEAVVRENQDIRPD